MKAQPRDHFAFLGTARYPVFTMTLAKRPVRKCLYCCDSTPNFFLMRFSSRIHLTSFEGR